jgi:deoxyribodipyrimidine photo-lyase
LSVQVKRSKNETDDIRVQAFLDDVRTIQEIRNKTKFPAGEKRLLDRVHMLVNPKRIRILVDRAYKNGPIIYWMSRDQRTRDNWALLFAKELSLKFNAPLEVIFCLVPEFLGASTGQYHFMLQGLRKTEQQLKNLGVPFFMLYGHPEIEVFSFIQEQGAGVLVSDFSPLCISQGWKRSIASRLDIPFYEVDAHNIVPCWLASNKQEYAAYTFRPKIHSLLFEYLEEFPGIKQQNIPWKEETLNDWVKAENVLKVFPDEERNPEHKRIEPGEDAAASRLKEFINESLAIYEKTRNDPSKNVQSGLSPYLHFGQISGQRVALDILASMKDSGSFLEELIVRRELSDNFCYYNSHYDTISGFPDWSRRSLEEHRLDNREYVYAIEDFEDAKTHDNLWNAAQTEMVLKGKMHGYMRMYWAKKILEWTESPEEGWGGCELFE